MRRLAVAAVLSATGLAASAPPAPAPPPAAGPVATPPERVIVRFDPGAAAEERGRARRDADVEVERTLALEGLQVVLPQRGRSVAEAVRRLRGSKAVSYAEPDHPRHLYRVPDDPLYGHLWGLQAIAAPAAWDVTTGSPDVVVAVVDTGVDAGHPDLAPNLRAGYDFADEDDVPQDVDGHGTHVAGTIAARGNDGVGVTGVAWSTSMLPLRVLGADGRTTASEVVAAYLRAGREGARVINASLGGTDFSHAERDALQSLPQTLVVAAAGNDGADNDSTGSFPCNYDLPNIVCVAATGSDGALAGFSNRGATTVDLGAPGAGIGSTFLDGRYVSMDGTSMAAPHVSGVAALLWAMEPGASVARVRSALLGSTVPAPSLQGVTVTGGGLNAEAAVKALAGSRDPAPAATAAPAPAAAPAPGAGPDTVAPRVAVRAASRISRRRAAMSGLRVTVTCSEACRLGMQLRHGSAVVGRLRAVHLGTRPVTLRVRLTDAGARRLRSRLPAGVVLRVVANDRAGNARTAFRGVAVR
jgi:subtilisin family serine protease